MLEATSPLPSCIHRNCHQGGVVPPTLAGATCTKATLTDELKSKIGADQDTGDDDVEVGS